MTIAQINKNIAQKRRDHKNRKYRRYSALIKSHHDTFNKWRTRYLEMICQKVIEKARHQAWDYRVRKSVVDGGHLLSGVSNVIE